MFPRNTLFYGDNLDWLRDCSHFPDASVDLVYLDPPFNSNRNYNILFKDRSGSESAAQVRAFEDSWEWGHESQETYIDLTQRGFAPGRIQELLVALRPLLGTNNLFAYLVMMTARLIELHRVLKPTGSLYLHCDPTASHYLKLILDAVLGPRNFRNEIIWKRTTAHSSAKKYAPVHDTLLYYAKSDKATWNTPRADYDEGYLDKYYRFDDGDGRLYWRDNLCAAGVRNGRSGVPWRGIDPAAKGMHWKFAVERLDELDAEGRIYWPKNGIMPQYKRYRDELKGKAVSDIWADIPRINPVGNERLGFQTQKPVALVSRIIEASSNPGDVVLDAFCGCGTTIDAAQRLGRQWVGIDVTILAVDLIRKRIEATFGHDVANDINLFGIPNEPAAARALFEKDPFEFERWLVTLVDGEPNERPKQSGDRGIDGIIRFPIELSRDGFVQNTGQSLISVKGGKQLNPSMVRDLWGTVDREKAEMGLLLTLNRPTDGMRIEARSAGNYIWPWNHRPFQKLQIAAVEDLLNDRKPEMPTPIPPYTRAQRLKMDAGQLAMF